MHDVYCLQLERFLCRECGKVKCSCGTQNLTEQSGSLTGGDAKEPQHNSVDESVEYRKPAEFTRQYSRSEQPVNFQKPLPLSVPRPSEQPFERSYQGENGKLRRSFIVRSREGLENFLNFSSPRKGQDQGKGKQMLQRQF